MENLVFSFVAYFEIGSHYRAHAALDLVVLCLSILRAVSLSLLNDVPN
jgi:hypothetical protein